MGLWVPGVNADALALVVSFADIDCDALGLYPLKLPLYSVACCEFPNTSSLLCIFSLIITAACLLFILSSFRLSLRTFEASIVLSLYNYKALLPFESSAIFRISDTDRFLNSRSSSFKLFTMIFLLLLSSFSCHDVCATIHTSCNLLSFFFS